VYFALIALLWYAVSAEITGWNRNRLSSLTHKTSAGMWLDLLLVCFGFAVGFVGELVRHQFAYVSLYSNLIAAPYVLWGVILVMFYGRDLWISARVSVSKVSGPGLGSE
jgi:hypothetical protein